MLNGHLPTPINLAFHALLATGCIIGLVTRGCRVHEAIGVTFAAAIGSYIAILFTHLA